LAGYLGKFEVPAGVPSPSLFPLFPWLAYALAGAAWGALLRKAKQQSGATGPGSSLEETLLLSALVGAALALTSSEALPFVHHGLAAHAWLVYPVRVAFRIGLVLVIALVGWVWTGGGRGRVGLDFGQASLRIYWAHMLFAYGVLGRLLQKRLDFLAWASAVLILLIAMWGLSRLSAGGIKSAAFGVRT
jgi:hypothetical protein